MLPADFCKRALSSTAKYIKLIDEEIRTWYCHLSEVAEDSTHYRWRGFMHLNNLVDGEVVTFGTIYEGDCTFFFKRVPPTKV